MTRILVTGASGLLGLNFCLQFATRHDIVGCINTHGLRGVPFQVVTADLSQPGSGERLLLETKPEWVLHCAALANLEACEKDTSLAQRLNAELPGELARTAARLGIGFTHISTDAVFDGIRGNYTEADQPHPVNVYSRTKLEGEQAVAEANPQAIIARVNFYGWSLSGKRSLAEYFFNNLSVGRDVNGFKDVYFCPLQVLDLGDILMQMQTQNLQGLYHVLSPEQLSKYDFGVRLACRFGLDENRVKPIMWREGGLTAVRSPNLTLRVDKLANDLHQELPGIEDGLKRFFNQYQHGIRKAIQSLVE